MLPSTDSRIVRWGLLLFFVVALGYAYFEGRALLQGPRIDIASQAASVSSGFFTVEGTAERITSLSLNGKDIPVTEEGAFKEGHVLAPGYNRLILKAEDRYGKTEERIIEVQYEPGATPPDPSTSPATSTPSID